MIRSVNPATGELLAEYPAHTVPEICAIIEDAHLAFLKWKREDATARAERFLLLAGQLRARSTHLARLAAEEMGKPITDGKGEVEKCAWVCEYFAEKGPAMLADQAVATEASESFISFQPLGVILAVMPWNFPIWQVLRAGIPTILAGNALVLKHASNVPRCALAIETLFRESGFPHNLVRTLLCGPDGASVALAHERVHGITLTGSAAAGAQLASLAGTVLKKCVMELGGSDPYIILEDADLDLAARVCAQARCANAGQVCIAAKRFITVDKVREAFEEKLIARMREWMPGDPLDPKTKLGPLARAEGRKALHKQVQDSIAGGALLRLGGEPMPGPGNFYPPTLLSGVKPGMVAFDDETFGPVAAIVPARDETEAIALANRHRYGLGAAVFTRDIARGRRIARDELDAGACVVNDLVKSDPRMPFGGVKQSGYGRELGLFGIREFVNIKTIVVR